MSLIETRRDGRQQRKDNKSLGPDASDLPAQRALHLYVSNGASAKVITQEARSEAAEAYLPPGKIERGPSRTTEAWLRTRENADDPGVRDAGLDIQPEGSRAIGHKLRSFELAVR